MSYSVEDWHTRFSVQAEWTRSIRSHLLKSDSLNSSSQVLEVGCGTGAILSEFMAQSPSHTFGLDISADNLTMAMRIVPGAHLTRGDAHQLPYPSSFFDISFCHFLLLWVAHPAQVVREMTRVTKPGGSVLAFAEPDYGGRIDHPPALSQLGEWQQDSLRAQGADPLIGRKLSHLFHQSFLDCVEVGILGAQWKYPHTQSEIESEWYVTVNDLEKYHPIGWNDQIDDLRTLNFESWKKGERILFVPTFYARGKVPG